MTKNVFQIIIVFIVGLCGGLLAEQIFSPLQYQFSNGPVSVVENKEVIVQENSALQDSVEKIEGSIVGIKSKKDGEIISGSGLIVTTDGLIVTLSSLVPSKGDFVFFIDGGTPNWKVLKRDKDLALIKVEMDDLKTVAFANFNEVRLGQRVFLVGTTFTTKPLKIVNEGIVRFFTSDYIVTNIREEKALEGSALFNIKGELLGLNRVNLEGVVTTISATEIKEFLGY